MNLHYLVSDDPYTRHRALHLRRLSTDLSGRYSCRVSSIYEEDFRSRDLIIYGDECIVLQKVGVLKRG